MIARFSVQGTPAAKQSFRVGRGGKGGYTPENVKAWEEQVGWQANTAMAGEKPVAFPVEVVIVFHLPDHQRRDVDNLAKGTLDGMKKIVFKDDAQVEHLDVTKKYDPCWAGAVITVREWWG